MTDSMHGIFFLFALCVGLSSCAPIFEKDADTQARKALQDLMEIQEAYHKEHGKYARNLLQIEKYNLKYHTGIVYLEIESADKTSYRAVSLPAESTTARVFAYDTGAGGFYEMDDEEVSQYVLGALNFIRKEQMHLRLNDWSSYLLMAILLVLGIRIARRYMEKTDRPAFGSYFISLLPLAWSVAVLNRMAPEIVVSNTIIGCSAAALVLAILSLLVGFGWFIRHDLVDMKPSVLGILGTAVILSLFNAGVMIHTLVTYLQA